jgi:hypothetical protein
MLNLNDLGFMEYEKITFEYLDELLGYGGSGYGCYTAIS